MKYLILEPERVAEDPARPVAGKCYPHLVPLEGRRLGSENEGRWLFLRWLWFGEFRALHGNQLFRLLYDVLKFKFRKRPQSHKTGKLRHLSICTSTHYKQAPFVHCIILWLT